MTIRGYTNVQNKMLAILADGLPHTRQELHTCLADELGPLTNIQQHISGIRKHLKPKGQNIVCELFNRTIHYRHVRMLASPNDGKQ